MSFLSLWTHQAGTHPVKTSRAQSSTWHYRLVPLGKEGGAHPGWGWLRPYFRGLIACFPTYISVHVAHQDRRGCVPQYGARQRSDICSAAKSPKHHVWIHTFSMEGRSPPFLPGELVTSSWVGSLVMIRSLNLWESLTRTSQGISACSSGVGVSRWFFWRTELNSLGCSLHKYWGFVFEAALQLLCGSSLSCEQATMSLWPTDCHWHNQTEQEFITDLSPRFKELKRNMHITLNRVPDTCSVPNKNTFTLGRSYFSL